jgi:hypothetical protein
MAEITAQVRADPPADYHPVAPTTTAPEGAPIEEVLQGMYGPPASTSQDGQAPYAPEGSLSKHLKEQETKQQGSVGESTSTI